MNLGTWAYQNGWYFFLYAFLGWCCEVIFAAARHGRFVNRGFLNGPICPIYGCGLVLVVAMLEPLGGNNWLLFLISAVLTTGIEFIAGFLMERLFHHRWWDYSRMPLNIGGYVCLPFSLIWGAACVLIVRVLHPLTVRLVAWIPHGLGVVLLALFAATFLADLIVTVLSIARLNRRLAELDEARKRLRRVSDALGEGLSDGTIAVKKRLDRSAADVQQRVSDGAAEAHRRLGVLERRLLSAFPNMRSLHHAEALDALREQQRQLRQRLKALQEKKKRRLAALREERKRLHREG